MQPRLRKLVTGAVLVLIGFGLGGLLGCGVAPPRTHPIKGRVVLAGRDPLQLAGGHVEAVLADDHRIQAMGEIQPDGSFTLETVYNGETLEGAREGEYQARIVLSDEDKGARRRRNGPALARRFSQFKTSGLRFQVPTDREIVLKVSPR